MPLAPSGVPAPAAGGGSATMSGRSSRASPRSVACGLSGVGSDSPASAVDGVETTAAVVRLAASAAVHRTLREVLTMWR
ncbi:hypothetical protein AW27_013675 [Streptomyces sp. PCS3-D2]|uniref:hypothetical protein n=1 Tax=Streptomyces sp. PCS3-D2 TaxID=1460244 RepID=UPI00272BBB89|nr:hypothetical protein [Streptomyces sp. PCS3-D2]WKV72480.1 hypothetical protein AW27_013675 [Streptomyces sp. PCS3-D2]